MFQVLRKFDRDRRLAGRKVILLVDNAKSHFNPTTIGSLNLTNVTVHFLPANTTSILQPLDRGIIRSFKCCYRRYLCRYIISLIDSGLKGPYRVDVKQAILMIVSAWHDVTSTTIQNCWRNAGIMYLPPTTSSEDAGCDPDSDDAADDIPLADIPSEDPEMDLPLSELRDLMRQLDPESNQSADDYIHMDDSESTEPTPDIDEIIASVTNCPVDDVEDDPVGPPPPTRREAVNHLQEFLRYFTSTMSDSHCDATLLDSLLAHQQRLETSAIQSHVQGSITDYFNNQ